MVPNSAVKAKTAAYLLINDEIKQLKLKQENLKKELSPYLAEAETNARGSYVLTFDDPLEVLGQRYASLQRVRKESKVLNEERVMDWLAAKVDSDDEADIHWDDIVSNAGVIVTVQHVDQDVLWDLFVQDLITQEEFDSFLDVTVTWAFSPVKE